MKNIAKLACILGVLSVGGAAAAVPNAMTISANSFADFNTGGGVCVNRVNNGISNICTSDTNFSYGIPKGPSSAGYTVTFTGRHQTTGLTSSPTLFSNAADGTFLTFFTALATNNGNWSKSITFTAAQAPGSGRLTAIVGLPANQQGYLYGLSLAY
jgi:hypothetical protein